MILQNDSTAMLIVSTFIAWKIGINFADLRFDENVTCNSITFAASFIKHKYHRYWPNIKGVSVNLCAIKIINQTNISFIAASIR